MGGGISRKCASHSKIPEKAADEKSINRRLTEEVIGN